LKSIKKETNKNTNSYRKINKSLIIELIDN